MSAFITSTTCHRWLRKQRGAVLMIMLILLVIATTTIIVSALSHAGVQSERDQISMRALAQAKEALIGYAVTYYETHSGSNVNGLLPCPDQGQNSTVDGQAKGSCGSKNISQIGRLPWYSLGLPPLKDGNGDCLWYAISGTYKNNPDTDLMNWDTYGLFQVIAADGVNIIAGSAVDNQAVAVIFSPGPPIGNETRSLAANSPSCGGNYTTSNYLENDTVHGINNATPSTIANAVSKFISGPVKDLSNTEILNDRLLIVTRNDIFNAIKKRSDFGTSFVASLLSTAATCSSTPVTIDFGTMTETPISGMAPIKMGRLPSSCLPAPYDKWQDNLLYAMCSMGTCLTVNGISSHGIVIFTGEAQSTQSRNTNTQKNTWSNYLEDTPTPNLTAFNTGGATYTGATAYLSTSPSSDVLIRIP